MDGFRVMSKAGDGWMDESQSNRVMDAGDGSPDPNPTRCHLYTSYLKQVNQTPPYRVLKI